MCGIAGFTQYHHKFGDSTTLGKMGEAIAHRGPDANGIFFNETVGLAHQRLSIIDLSKAGDQPMVSYDGRYVIVFNGEIYNYLELRKELAQQGYPFKTKTDTEVILALYEKNGEKMVHKLNGMFALAIWDKNKQSVFLARDRIGKKPLYYYKKGSDIAFASEIKALLVLPNIPRNIRMDALYDYFAYQYVPDPKTIFEDIYKLEPGHCMTVSNEKITIQQYWDVSFANTDKQPEQDVSNELYQLAEQCTLRRLISDVPLGAFLSGGIDSSAIVGLMANNSDTAVTTCSIGFDDEKYNEVEFARMVAEKYNTNHHELYVHDNVEDNLERIVRFFDEPFSDPSLVPTFFVSELARKKVTVALSGDGGDEIFAGYEKYNIDAIENNLRNKFPAFIRHHLFPALSSFANRFNSFTLFKKAGTLLNSLSVSPAMGFYQSNAQITDNQWKLLANDRTKQALADYHPSTITLDAYNRADANDHLSKILYTDMKTYLPGDILVKVDRMSMAHSLEVRAPLLDYEMIEFAAKIPSILKFNKGEKKYILKKTFNRLLPDNILYRKKMGFSVPLDSWLRNELKLKFEHKVLAAENGVSDYFNMHQIETLWQLHQSQKADNSAQLWSLLMFQMWWDNYMAPSAQKV